MSMSSAGAADDDDNDNHDVLPDRQRILEHRLVSSALVSSGLVWPGLARLAATWQRPSIAARGRDKSRPSVRLSVDPTGEKC